MDRNDKLRRAWSVGAAVALGALGLAACAPVTALNSVTVTTTVDGSDLDPGDGVCEMTSGAGDCSLRAAVDEANADDEITYAIVPPGTYVLDGGGAEDANVTGDLDVAPAAGLLTFLATPGVVIDAGGSAGGIDARSGLTFLNGISVTGSSAAGLVARSGADLWVFRGSPHGNDGPGLVYEAGAGGQIYNTTVSGNGDGIHNAGEVTLGFATVTANAGAGVSGPGTTTVTGSVVANQSGGADCTTPVTSLGGNAFGEAGCGVGPDDTLDPDVDLTPELVDGVPGFVPGPSSPDLRDAIAPGQAPCQPGMLAVDQHNVTRPLGAGCDKGALETEAATPDFIVDTAVDGVDAAPGDGVCDDGTGACTLRAAVQESIEVSGTQPALISIAAGIDPVLAPMFGPSGILEAMTITGDVTIDGDGATVHMSNRETVFAIGAGHATFRDITLTGASASSGFLASAGTDPARSLTLDHATLTGNEWNAVAFGGESLTIVDSIITGTEQTAVSAGVADLVVERSSLLGNKDHMIASAARATIVDSTYNGSQIGLWLTTTESTRIERSTFAQGDGLRLAGPDTLVANSTVSGGSFFGIQVTGGSAEIVGTTVSDLFVAAVAASGSAQVTVRGSALLGYDYTCFEEGTSSITSGGYNVAAGTSCGFAVTGDVQGVTSLGIGPLADNGGPTRTRLPATGSLLVDAIPAGTPGLCDAASPIDQRGVSRPQGPACDIGSVEK